MRKTFWILFIILASCSWSRAQDQTPQDQNNDDSYYDDNSGYNEEQADNEGMSYQTFYDQLSPYGSWINYPGYGYVWVPQANAGFSPYETDGSWQYTDYGWTWVSDYAWGWATFHYGRWFNDPAYGGWLWMPGYDWAPAWVNWGMYGDYYCWTPIGPRDFVNGRWGYGAYDHHWSCLPRGRMGEPGIGRYIVGNEVVNHDRAGFERGVTMVNHTNTCGRSVFNAGPRVEDVQKVVNHPIKKMTIENTSKADKTGVHGSSISIYRPTVSRSAGQQHAVPSKVVNPSETPHANDAVEILKNNETRNNSGGTRSSNTNPGHSAPLHNNNNNTEPARENTNIQRTQPERETSSPPRQSAPERSYGGGGFIPSERPSEPARSAPAASFRAAPAPSFHSAPAGGGGFHGGGGGRHR